MGWGGASCVRRPGDQNTRALDVLGHCGPIGMKLKPTPGQLSYVWCNLKFSGEISSLLIKVVVEVPGLHEMIAYTELPCASSQ